jgi:hypothetical protein
MAAETNPVQIQIQTNQIFDENKHCCGYCRRSPHVCGLIYCMVVWGLLISTICAFATFGVDQIFGWVTGAILVGAYVGYLIEAFVSKTSRYLWNMKVVGGDDIGMYIERLKKAPPLVSMTCQCFHYETRTRYVTETYTEYVNGQSVRRTRQRRETYQERVVTYNGYEIFNYTEWSDNSGFLSDEILKYNVMRIDLFKSCVAGNPETTEAFKRQYDEFQEKHRYRDTHFKSFYGFDIDDYKPNILSVVQQKWYLNWGIYAIITIFCLSSVFYRYWFDRYSVKGNFELKKIIKL